MYASAARAFISRARVNAARSRLSAVECTFFAVALERISAIDHRRRSASAGGRSRLSTLDSSGAAARIKAPVYRATSAKSRGLTCLVRKSRTTSGRIGGAWKRLPICSQIASTRRMNSARVIEERAVDREAEPSTFVFPQPTSAIATTRRASAATATSQPPPSPAPGCRSWNRPPERRRSPRARRSDGASSWPRPPRRG